MTDPRDKLPPVNALRVFWIVMRKGSFRAAADALLVTPQAVSQQIKQLEESMGVTLFDRKGRVISPTEQAIVLSHFVEAGFRELQQGVRRVTGAGTRQRININVSPYFATRYLMQRLERFRAKRPGADLRLTTMVHTPDFGRDEVDVSIQWGFGEWPDAESTLLVRDPKILCCTQTLAETVAQPSDLLCQTLLHAGLARELWPKVLRHLGVEGTSPLAGMEFSDAATLRRATLSGLGVGLVSRLDADADIAAGRLVAPFGADALTSMEDADIPGFFLVVPPAHRRVSLIAAFCDWVVSEDWDTPVDPPPYSE